MQSWDDARFRKTLTEVVSTVGSTTEWREIAREWGISYKSLNSWLSTGPKNRFPAEFLVPLCKALNNYRLLDCLEESSDRIAFGLPALPSPHVRGKFRDVLRKILDDPACGYDQKLIADKLGTDYRQLRYFITGGEERHLPAEMVVPLCKHLNDFRLLDFLELQAGRLAFARPDIHHLGVSDITEFHKLLEDAMEAVRTGSVSLRDNRIDEAEAHAIIEKLDAVIRRCVQVRLLVERHLYIT